MKKINYLIICLVVLSSSSTFAQYGIGTDSPSATALLDINSTTKGLLVPRLTSTQRDAITTPANALLIFNTSNNTFEVYKSTCSCWVTVNDNGDTPAKSLVNTPPVAYNLNVAGSYLVGKVATLTFQYADAQKDAQGLTTIDWQRATTAAGGDPVTIAGATSATYTFQPGDLAAYVRARVFPRAATGVLNGVVATTGWTLVEAATTPTVNNLLVTGTTSVGSALTASYTFSGGTGIEDTTPTTFAGLTSGTQYVWQSANSAAGDGINNTNVYGAFSYTNTYTPQNDLLGRFIRVAVKAKDSGGLQPNNWVYSPWVGPITATTEAAPVASNVTYTPAPAVALVHTASYSYYDVNFDPEGTSTFQWYRANDAAGAGAVAIPGATSSTYTAVPADGNKFIGFGVTPKALTGTTTGTEVRYYNTNAVAPVATFTFTSSTVRQLPFYHASKAMNAQNAIQIEVDVTAAGGLSISSTSPNGYSYAGNFTLATGPQWITLTPTGTQTSYNSSGDLVALNGVGATTETKNIQIKHVRFGSAFTAHYNGITGTTNIDNTLTTYTSGEVFSNNSGCTSSLISTGACPAGNTFTSASGKVYPTVLINGQCWMQANLDEIPSNYASVTPTSWLATTIGHVGQHGYYNAAVTNGTAGWGTTVPGTNHGRLYQWSAVMNGAATERAQGACPQGWHVPSACEWRYLLHGIGMSIAHTNTMFNNVGAVGQKLVTSGTNSSGFAGINVGLRGNNGVFTSPQVPYLWTSTASGSNGGSAVFMVLNNPTTFQEAWQYDRGISVRCLRD
jgi:uncharacterized protein (TIGR02145 family)